MKKKHRRTVRIIGGRWRGTRIPVPDVPDLRPTPDRLRETLFNWLAPRLPGSRCLDLFAGTGVLGLEALSRGAASVAMVDASAAAARRIRETIDRLEAGDAVIHCADAWRFLDGEPEPFDVVFLDPPFALRRYRDLCTLLAHKGWLASGAAVSVECARGGRDEALPAGWTCLREAEAGQVSLLLAAPGDGPDGRG